MDSRLLEARRALRCPSRVSGWSDYAHELSRVFGASIGTTVLVRNRDRACSLGHALALELELDEKTLQEVAFGAVGRDPALTELNHLSSSARHLGEVVGLDDVLTPDLRRSPFINEIAPMYRLDQYHKIMVPIGEDQLLLVSVHYESERERRTREGKKRELLAHLADDMVEAAYIHLLSGRNHLLSGRNDFLEASAGAVVEIDYAGQILESTESADALLAHGDVVGVGRAGRLEFSDPGCTAWLEAQLPIALRGCLFTRRYPGGRWAIEILDHDRETMRVRIEVGTCKSPRLDDAGLRKELMQRYGLTEKQAACGVLYGRMSASEVATQESGSLGTVRKHIQQGYNRAKTREDIASTPKAFFTQFVAQHSTVKPS